MIREGGQQDVRFLRDMLRHAYYWRSRDTEFPITRYVNAWGRDGDRALIALDDFHEVGAAWYRLYSEREPGFGFVDAATPELTIGVVPSRRGKGIGSSLLDALLEQARGDGLRPDQPVGREDEPRRPPVREPRLSHRPGRRRPPDGGRARGRLRLSPVVA